MKQLPYHRVAIAGTFDRLHKGHKHFISEAFKYGEKVVIGLMSDNYISKIKNQKSILQFKIKIYTERKKEVLEFLKESGLTDRAVVVEIDDMYGPAVDARSGIEALIVTTETQKGGEEVNKKRKKLGLIPVELQFVDMINADDEERISSTRIRGGEIDRIGMVFRNQLSVVSGKLPEKVRQALKKPQGKLIEGDPDNLLQIRHKLVEEIRRIQPPLIITVGDEVTRLANEIGLAPKLSIFDFKVNRIERYNEIEELGITQSSYKPITQYKTVNNPAGYITKELVEAVEESYKALSVKREGLSIIKINGEDDLAAVPGILLAPLGTVVLYGQPLQVGWKIKSPGIVVVEVTEETKDIMANLLNG